MTRRLLETLAMVATVAAAVVLITGLGAASLPRVTRVPPPLDTKVACLPASDSGTAYLTGADRAGALGEPATARGADTLVVTEQRAPVVASGTRSIVGGFLATAGSTSEWTPCGPALARGSLVVASTADTELLLVNPDSTDASVDLTLLGADGEITALGSRGIVVGGNSSRVVALSVLAPDAGPVAVDFTASRGRAVILARSTTATGLSASLATPLGTHHLLPGVPARAGTATVLVGNPGADRATVDVTAFGAAAGYQPAGGRAVEVPARSAVAIPLVEALQAEVTNLSLSSDFPVTAALVTGGADPAVVSPVAAGTQMAAVLPAGGTLQVSSTSDQPVAVTVTDSVAVQAPTTTNIVVPAGALVSVPLATEAPQGHTVRLSATQDVFGAVTFEGSVVPLQVDGPIVAEPLAAEVDPTLN